MYDRSKFSFVILTAFVFLFCIACIGISESYSLNEEDMRKVWNIRFSGVEVISSTAKEYNNIKINDKNTSLTNLGFIFDNVGDSITYKINVINSGNINAKVSTFLINEGKCNNTVCNNLEYKLTNDNGSEVKKGDLIEVNNGVSYYLTIKYTGEELVEPLTVDNVGLSINYMEG